MIINETYHRHLKVGISLDAEPVDGLSSDLSVAFEQTMHEEDDLFAFVERLADLCCERIARVWINDMSTVVTAQMKVEWIAVFGAEGGFDPSRTVCTSVFGGLELGGAVDQKTLNQAKFNALATLRQAALANFKLLHKGEA